MATSISLSRIAPGYYTGTVGGITVTVFRIPAAEGMALCWGYTATGGKFGDSEITQQDHIPTKARAVAALAEMIERGELVAGLGWCLGAEPAAPEPGVRNPADPTRLGGWFELSPAAPPSGLIPTGEDRLKARQFTSALPQRLYSIAEAIKRVEAAGLPLSWFVLSDWYWQTCGERTGPEQRGECLLSAAKEAGYLSLSGVELVLPEPLVPVAAFRWDTYREGDSREARVRVLLPLNPNEPLGECYLCAEFPYVASSYPERVACERHAETWIEINGPEFRLRVAAGKLAKL